MSYRPYGCAVYCSKPTIGFALNQRCIPTIRTRGGGGDGHEKTLRRCGQWRIDENHHHQRVSFFLTPMLWGVCTRRTAKRGDENGIRRRICRGSDRNKFSAIVTYVWLLLLRCGWRGGAGVTEKRKTWFRFLLRCRASPATPGIWPMTKCGSFVGQCCCGSPLFLRPRTRWTAVYYTPWTRTASAPWNVPAWTRTSSARN